VKNAVNAVGDAFKGIRPGYVTFNQLNARFIQKILPAAASYQAAAEMAFTQQFFYQMGADEAGCSGN